MKRLLYLDKKSNEIEDLLAVRKNVIVRGANIKKYPYKMIEEGYRVYFMNNNSEGVILASATILDALFIEEENYQKREELLNCHDFRLSKDKLDYVKDRKYISIFTLDNIKKEYATLDHSLYGVKDDWMIVNDIK